MDAIDVLKFPFDVSDLTSSARSSSSSSVELSPPPWLPCPWLLLLVIPSGDGECDDELDELDSLLP